MHSRTTLLILAIIIFVTPVRSQEIDGNYVIGKRDSVYSGILKEKRRLWIYVPNMYAQNRPKANERYPVLYLLDGDAHFHSVTGLIQQLSQIHGSSTFPEMIVVGISNTDRFRDLTPTHTDSMPFHDGPPPPNVGGGELFTSFIEKELIPHIDSLYPTTPYRVMVGHSLGGLMVLNTLINHPQLFNSYIAIDPSLWWHDQRLLKASAQALHTHSYKGKSLFLGIANTLPPHMDTIRMRKDTSSGNIHQKSIFTFRDILRKGPVNGLRWDVRYYPDDDHGSVPLITEYDGLRFIFNMFRNNLGNSISDSNFDFTSATIAYYEKLSREMGYQIKPPEYLVNSIGQGMILQKRFDQALRLFFLNTTNYPSSANTFDSLGDLYASTNDKAKAVEAYTQALRLFDNPVTRGKLDKLNKK